MVTQAELEAKLWGAADILRGAIDSSDYKNYIFGFLFLKRLSDVFEEEAEKIKAETGDHDLAWNEPDEHNFYVPVEARWSSLRSKSENMGEALNKAAATLEDQNPKLKGILAGVDFNDERKIGNTRQRDNILTQLITHFSGLNLRQSNLKDPDILGRAYEYLIEKFADDAGKKGGEFYTPRKVVELLVRLLNPAVGMRICDPTCGSGGMLIQCVEHIKHSGGNIRNISLFGQEKNLGTWAICQMNMILHNIFDFDIRKGDVIREPALIEGGELMLFDLVIANPPFSLDKWGHEVTTYDGFGRFSYGVPPKSKGDYAFIQHMIATLKPQGRAGVVVPHGVLFRGGSEGKIRQGLLEDDLVEAVIGLPNNLFYGTGIPGAILILNRHKSEERKDKVIFIDASREYQESKNQNALRPEDINHIVSVYQAFNDEDKYAQVVDLKEIEKNDFNLNISRYVITTESEKAINLDAEINKLQELETQRAEAEKLMNHYLKELGFDISGLNTHTF